MERESLRVTSVARSTSLSPRTMEKEIAKRSSSSPAAVLSDRIKSPPISPQRSLSVRPPNSNDDDAAAAITSTTTTTTSLSLDATFPETSPQSQFSSELCDTGQDVSLSEEGAESGVNEEQESNSIRNSFLSIPLVTDDPSDSDKERHVTKGR